MVQARNECVSTQPFFNTEYIWLDKFNSLFLDGTGDAAPLCCCEGTLNSWPQCCKRNSVSRWHRTFL